MKRGWVIVAVVAAVGACKDKAKDARPTGAPGSAGATAVEKAPVKIDGPSVAPTVTSSITYFVPKQATWWGELAFPCYASTVTLQPGNRPSDAFTKISPMVEPALRAAGIDLDKDLTAVGAWGCGPEATCIYLAVNLRDPAKLEDTLAMVSPAKPPKELGKHHWVIDAPGAQGARTIHVQALPIAWPAKLPGDTWSRKLADATHLIFLTGMMGDAQVDPIAAAADAQTAAAKVANIEGLVTNASGRCVLGEVAKRSFQPGYELDRSRFILAAPEGKGDPLTNLLTSKRTLDLEVELVLSPAPTEKVVQKWIAEARAFVAETAAPIRAQFAAQGEVVDAMFDLAALLGKSGFRHTIKDKALTLSFRTDRITQRELSSVEARLESALGAAGISP